MFTAEVRRISVSVILFIACGFASCYAATNSSLPVDSSQVKRNTGTPTGLEYRAYIKTVRMANEASDPCTLVKSGEATIFGESLGSDDNYKSSLVSTCPAGTAPVGAYGKYTVQDVTFVGTAGLGTNVLSAYSSEIGIRCCKIAYGWFPASP